MKDNNKNKVLFYTFAILALILLSSITYAYFSAGVSNTNHETVTAETATLALVFEDNDNGVSGNLSIGESITKKFTIENTGTKDTYAKINFYNLINTYTEKSLSWVLKQSTSANGSFNSVGSGFVPVSNSNTTENLKNGLLIPVNTKYYYELVITLNNLDINQNSDINANMNSKFTIEEGNTTDNIIDVLNDSSVNTSSTDVITRESSENSCTNTLAYDGTSDNNLRYVGTNPCNYVLFNNELWRIIGMMKNIDDGTGQLESRLKLIKDEPLGNYSWDSSASGINSAWGINDWTGADLMNELNGDYLNTSLAANTSWYNGSDNRKTGVFDYTKRLSAGAQGLIGDTKWYLGGYSTSTLNANDYYTKERGNIVWGSTSGQTCNDGYCPRKTSWIGKVALIYPSDYGFAVGGSVRTNCLNSYLYNYSQFNCKENDWLFTNSNLVFITPRSNAANGVFVISNYYSISGGIYYSYATYVPSAIYPTVYLKSNVSISSGDGSPTNPFIVE